MDVCVLTPDLIFFSAVEGVAGAMGHSARQAAILEEVGSPALLIADCSKMAEPIERLAAAVDPLRTALFIPHIDADAFTRGRALGFAHVCRRGALATELPRLLAEYAGITLSE